MTWYLQSHHKSRRPLENTYLCHLILMHCNDVDPDPFLYEFNSSNSFQRGPSEAMKDNDSLVARF